MLHHVLYGLRMRAGLTQSDLAERSHLSRSHITMIEQGHRLPSSHAVRQLEEALGDEDHALTEALTALRLLHGRLTRGPGRPQCMPPLAS